MPDHYELLGVTRDATKDEIKQAYNEKRAAAEADGSATNVARLNEAWQTLADPYQRGRYDATLEAGGDAGRADDVEVVDDAPPPRRRGLFSPPEQAGAPPEPTIPIPAGMQLADQRTRLNAMLFDLAMLIVVFLIVQYAGAALIRNAYPDETDRLDALSDEIIAVNDVQDAQDKVDELEQDLEDADPDAAPGIQDDLDEARADLDDARTGDHADDFAAAIGDCTASGVDIADPAAPTADELGDCDDALNEEYDDVRAELQGANFAILAGVVVLSLAYLVLPGIKSGQTLGKRLRKIRVVHQDGSPLSLRGALARYGVPVVFVVFLVATPFALFGLALGLIGVLMWMRNPNRQGMHDRVAKTIVVDAS